MAVSEQLRETADPSAPVGMTKSEAADPSAPDDKLCNRGYFRSGRNQLEAIS